MKNIIKAKYRKIIGTKYSKKIRLINKIPAIIYYYMNNILIEINHNDIFNIIKNKKHKLIIINLKNKKINTNIHDIQYHPYKKKILHVDFIFKKT